MTETIEQNAANSGAASTDTVAPANGTKAEKSKPLSALLLPELRQLAASMGIATANKKKPELVSAIRAARSGGSAGASNAAANGSTPADGSAPAGTDRQDAARGGRQDGRRANAAASTATDARTDSGSDGGTTTRETRDEPNRESQDRDEPRGENARQGESDRGERQRDGQKNNRQNNRQANQGNNQQGSQNRGGSDNNQAQNNQGNNQNNQNNNSQNNNQDDDDRNGRRGRRYRDRRGRNRERGNTGGGGNNEVEPTISEDDVLVPVAGILDTIEDKNTWFVRTSGYFAGPDDVYVAASYIRRFNLRRGDAVTGAIRQLRDGERREKYNPLVRLDTVNGRNPEEIKNRIEFTKLTPLYPQERLRLETEPHILTTRVIDLVMPIGKGQRALIASPPKAGKTMVLQSIANAIATNNPEVHLMVVLVDERPEEVTDMQRSVKGEVIASTFDRRPQDHTMVAELSIERAKRLVEMGMDVVVLLDSITRLGRAYNLAAPASGRILSGGVDSTALYPPKRFLGAARNIENGGSLTIIATALVETGSAGDSVIFEEFKGTGNAELKLDRKIADKRTFPAIDVDQSSTRKEELLLSPDEMAVTVKLRRVLHALEPQQAIDLVLDRLRKNRTNYEFLMQIAKTTPGQDQ